jgi:hypothetical protein
MLARFTIASSMRKSILHVRSLMTNDRIACMVSFCHDSSGRSLEPLKMTQGPQQSMPYHDNDDDPPMPWIRGGFCGHNRCRTRYSFRRVASCCALLQQQEPVLPTVIVFRLAHAAINMEPSFLDPSCKRARLHAPATNSAQLLTRSKPRSMARRPYRTLRRLKRHCVCPASTCTFAINSASTRSFQRASFQYQKLQPCLLG